MAKHLDSSSSNRNVKYELQMFYFLEWGRKSGTSRKKNSKSTTLYERISEAVIKWAETSRCVVPHDDDVLVNDSLAGDQSESDVDAESWILVMWRRWVRVWLAKWIIPKKSSEIEVMSLSRIYGMFEVLDTLSKETVHTCVYLWLAWHNKTIFNIYNDYVRF